MVYIKLQSSDGEIFETDIQIAKCSGTIKTMLEDCGMDLEGDDAIVPLPNVNSAILRKVLHWANYHKDDPEVEDDEYYNIDDEDITPWDADFLNVDQGTLFELILAANYLDIKALLGISCKAVANMLKGKSAQEIRTTFNIKNDFTAAELEQVRRENEWVDK